jgi:capsular polysaccharide biosynthesis protein
LITTYQIRNVLRTYGNQLKKKSLQIKDSAEQPRSSSDFVNISVEARKKQMLNQISNDMISQVTYKSKEKKTEDNFSQANPLMNDSGERMLYEN